MRLVWSAFSRHSTVNSTPLRRLTRPARTANRSVSVDPACAVSGATRTEFPASVGCVSGDRAPGTQQEFRRPDLDRFRLGADPELTSRRRRGPEFLGVPPGRVHIVVAGINQHIHRWHRRRNRGRRRYPTRINTANTVLTKVTPARLGHKAAVDRDRPMIAGRSSSRPRLTSCRSCHGLSPVTTTALPKAARLTVRHLVIVGQK